MPEIKMPETQYVGPSQDDIDAQNLALTNFENTLTENNKTFQDGLTKQIETANNKTDTLMEKIANMNKGTAAAAASGGLTDAPYAITSESNVEETELAQTTSTIKDKKKPTGSLKINQGGLQSGAGTGVNYGV
tara:strand:+ start:262 stop:660 length:399 start_codon:yes stop_codon:yes gene_type:complete